MQQRNREISVDELLHQPVVSNSANLGYLSIGSQDRIRQQASKGFVGYLTGTENYCDACYKSCDCNDCTGVTFRRASNARQEDISLSSRARSGRDACDWCDTCDCDSDDIF